LKKEFTFSADELALIPSGSLTKS